MEKRSYVMYACPETESNIYYATGFMAPDPFLLIVKNGVRYMVMTDLEIDRAKKQSKAEEVISLSKTASEIDKNTMPPIEVIIEHLLKKLKMKSFEIPQNFPALIYSYLNSKGFNIKIVPDPFFAERAYKRQDEIKHIAHSQKITEEAMAKVAYILKESNIRGKRIYFDGTCVTSEYLKKVINIFLMEKNMVGAHTIVACGNDAVDPHNEGSGPIRPNESVIVDIFPRSMETLYFGDMTRTFVVGKPSEALLKLYDAV
ncbi:MAG: M24 family metallopeptidase, partial [Deltaproteobacteria bacterium]|nr:M24 family metallopeptidase [Deltaproteobacteria bacterium]